MGWLGKLLGDQGIRSTQNARDNQGARGRRSGLSAKSAALAGSAPTGSSLAGATGTSAHARLDGVAAQARPSKPVSNVLMLVDVSYTLGQEALDHVSGEGLRCILNTLRAQSQSTEILYTFALFAFSDTTEEVLGFAPAHELAARASLPTLECRSVTCMEDALWEAFARIDAEKAAQDAARTPRAGSLVLMVTDGRPTDETGSLKPLSALLVDEIRERNETRSTSTFVIGMGDVDDATLRQVGPPAIEKLPDGTCFESPRAVRYTGDDYRSRQCWEAVCSLVGRASSSSTGTPFVVGSEEEASRLPSYADALVFDATKFRVVR